MSTDPAVDVTLVVPFRDEAASLPRLVEEIDEMARGRSGERFEAVFVDDGSRDGGAEVIGAAAEGPVRRIVVRHGKVRGKSAALLTGFARARGPVIVTLDADLQNPPAEIPKLLDELAGGGWDAVLGVRTERRDGWAVRAASRIANRVRGWVLGDGASDSACGLQAFRRELADGLPGFEGLHRFLPAFWKARGARVAQLPVAHRPRSHGESKYTVSGRARRGLVDLFGVRWLIARSADVVRPLGGASEERSDGPPRDSRRGSFDKGEGE